MGAQLSSIVLSNVSWPNARFAVTHPRWEPDASIGLVPFCAVSDEPLGAAERLSIGIVKREIGFLHVKDGNVCFSAMAQGADDSFGAQDLRRDRGRALDDLFNGNTEMQQL